MAKNLPPPWDLIKAQDWLRRGAPAYPSNRNGFEINPKKSIKTLLKLLEALPAYHDLYAYGTPENKAAYEELRAQEEAKAKRKRKK